MTTQLMNCLLIGLVSYSVMCYHNIIMLVIQTLNQPTQPITVTYNLSLEYSYTQFNVTYSYDETEIFSQISTDTDYTQSLRTPTIISNGPVVLVITATLRITKQCNTPFSDEIELTANTESSMTDIFLIYCTVT